MVTFLAVLELMKQNEILVEQDTNFAEIFVSAVGERIVEINNLEGIIESLLFAAGDEGLTIKQISEVIEMDDKVAEEVLSKLVIEYNKNGKRGITIVQLAETYQLQQKKSTHLI